ncbi:MULTISPECIES: hypothetical protein [Streptomyces]|uniref:Uncharacterized protein n=2 Tax=Streptomyces TaxID=1883 RepID=A0A2U9P3E1_STRAS|nr:hypothetical protein [Streptomyces actuosus]AWT43558.1 hypothetical protein DMT42_15345 [Streptomyces actuosus]MBM4824252.1 hypothetical protein [Streptomyces actuosus]
MRIETHLAREHAADLRAAADAHRLARQAAGHQRRLRTRLGWTLVDVGLRLAAPKGADVALAV